MIAFIDGTVASYNVDTVIIDHNGMGWEIAYPHTDELSLNKQVRIYTYMHISENDMRLFGFESNQEKELFIRLISVKGLGPKTAMGMLAKGGYDNIVKAIETEDVAALKKMPGIGAKSASQIVLDLKGTLVASDVVPKAEKKVSYPQEVADALEGLKNLGYRQGDLSSVVNIMLEQPGKTTAEYLRMGLQFLSRQG